MGFKDDILKLAVQISERKAHIANEETTKHSLIIPFIQVLGFDVFNPLEVQPEYIADFGKKRGEKVDYAIFKDGKPIIFIEAKSITEKLDNHNAQLSRYFNSTPEVKMAILTNGIQYKFFTDLNQNNVMDSTPFFEVDITNLEDNEIETITKFKKDVFDNELLVKHAEELVYMANLNKNLKELFKNPSDEFIRFLIKDFSDTRITSNVIEKFRPIVKKAISKTLLDIVSQGLSQQEPSQSGNEELINNTDIDNDFSSDKTPENIKKTIETTGEELESLEIIKNILMKHGKDVSELKYKDTTNYFGIFIKNGNYWFARLNLTSANKSIMVRLSQERVNELVENFKVDIAPKGIAESRVYIGSPKDLIKLENLIIAAYEDVAQ